MKPPRILVLGYGNPGRQDDGLGPAMANVIETWALPGVTVESDYQLNIEHAAALAQHEIVLFIDASLEAPAPFALNRIASSRTIAFTSHSVAPESVLAICEDHLGGAPEAWVLGIRGYQYELAEGLTPQAQENFEKAGAYIYTLIHAWRQRRPAPPL